ncbi:MAG: glycine zipper family protein [Limnohabitans sp.]
MQSNHSPKHLLRLASVHGLLLLTLAGCAGPGGNSGGSPVLYPNAAYKTMGEAAANQHLNQCLSLAQSSGLHPLDSNNSVASGATMGAAVAGVTGAVGGLVFGRGDLNQAIKYGAQSAVVGAAAGGTRGAMSQQPSGTYRQFAQRCAGEKGLDIIGWQ